MLLIKIFRSQFRNKDEKIKNESVRSFFHFFQAFHKNLLFFLILRLVCTTIFIRIESIKRYLKNFFRFFYLFRCLENLKTTICLTIFSIPYDSERW